MDSRVDGSEGHERELQSWSSRGDVELGARFEEEDLRTSPLLFSSLVFDDG